MKHRTPYRSAYQFAIVLCICGLLLLSSTSISQAQSGRKPPKPPTAPDPLPPKQEEPPIKPSSDQDKKNKIPVKVVWHLQTVNLSTMYPRIVQDGCLDRLSQSGSVQAGAAEDLNRKQAIDIAKGSTDTYVLWFELEIDVADIDRAGIGGVPPQYLYVRYELYTPGTGKTKSSGNVYQRGARGPGGMPVPLPRSNGSAEYLLRNCGREMADRVMDAISVARPPDR